MWTWFINFRHAFFYDELAFKRWLRGGLGFAAGVLTQLVADPLWSTWSASQWVIKLIPALVMFSAGSVTAPGSKKPQ